ncbi:Ribonuclease Z_ mitochondriallike [Caligus rogercresseyi]|uniref:Ribonuclease Z_ mitochondriallike n=1 Tax=Caligus rogercresseyi TaxID=217165 RepID=A0A7T8JV33_CALRO|nr:Ribonuclease Z_ mitochondriallike [Caligus rogercresseyi]
MDYPTVGFAFDFMAVGPGSFSSCHHLGEALKTLFKEDHELMATRREIFEYKMKNAQGQTEEDGEHFKSLISKLDHPNRKTKRLKLD